MPILLALAMAVTKTGADASPKGPAEAIAIADAHRGRGTTGVYVMRVAQAERQVDALYLNSSADYRAPDDVTFHLTPMAAKALEKRLGAKPETALIGRTVTVRGAIRAVPIVNEVAGRPRSFNRYQHTVMVSDPNQLRVD